jgi:arsenate reductase (thioredoxin)
LTPLGLRVKVILPGGDPIHIIPVSVQAMAEGIETATEQSKIFKAVKAFDVVITMGCGDRCSYLRGKRY